VSPGSGSVRTIAHGEPRIDQQLSGQADAISILSAHPGERRREHLTTAVRGTDQLGGLPPILPPEGRVFQRPEKVEVVDGLPSPAFKRETEGEGGPRSRPDRQPCDQASDVRASGSGARSAIQR
jgi:hypothetical protein